MADSSVPPTTGATTYVDWAAILGGAMAAVALSFVLLTAGAAIGLSLVSPYPSQSYGKWAGSVATAWALTVTIGAFLCGGYIAGRMRAAWNETDSDEVEFRDGLHGLLVWSASIFLGGALALVVGSAGSLVGAHVARPAGPAAARGLLLAPAVDALLRGADDTSAASGTASADLRDEVARILVAATSAGSLSARDRGYLSHVVARRAGLPPADADRRVNDTYAEAGRAIDLARVTAVLVGLVSATALMIGLAATWYAAQRGGHHRDSKIPAKFRYVRSQVA